MILNFSKSSYGVGKLIFFLLRTKNNTIFRMKKKFRKCLESGKNMFLWRKKSIFNFYKKSYGLIKFEIFELGKIRTKKIFDMNNNLFFYWKHFFSILNILESKFNKSVHFWIFLPHFPHMTVHSIYLLLEKRPTEPRVIRRLGYKMFRLP